MTLTHDSRAPQDVVVRRREPVPTYYEHFGEGIPRSLGKFAANTGQVETLRLMLEERVLRNERVTDWEEFAEPLVSLYRLRPIAEGRGLW